MYPALAVAPHLEQAAINPPRPAPVSATGASGKAAGKTKADRAGQVQLLWIGSIGGMEQALVERAGVPYTGIHTGQLRGKSVREIAVSVRKMAAGVRETSAIIERFRPDVCFVTGGYVSGPVVVACARRQVPVLIYLPDIVPGYAIRWESKLARRVAVTFDEAARWFGGEAPKGKAVVTGYPVRQELIDAAQDRPVARQRLAAALGVSFDEPTGGQLPLLLVWGGSQGARVINQATWASLADILGHAQVVHVIGNRDWPLYEAWRQEQSLPMAVAHRYHPVAYLHEEMALALAGADLTVARAGASALGEFPVARLPSILAPLAGVNQLENAQALAGRGAAIILKDEALAAELATTVTELLVDKPRRVQMERALADLARPDAAKVIAGVVAQLASSCTEGERN
ncbi:MAG: UDP-N-acetylglucosamine--N-acetylmuramyl-(pentapeptide) pyrophosphoryl-undecaprenol N-acetylglucosamine transferase [Anaerolineales bacterium]|nr:UDP-N-acetylglucosamine--N-acetylmuramyl-(pentapeptide) pyrophosphoryl-undecaprenol N-acetylglucosamine transferase [Anaerolineales bacterium]